MNGLSLVTILEKVQRSEMINELDDNRALMNTLIQDLRKHLTDNKVIEGIINNVVTNLSKDKLPIIYNKMVSRLTADPSYFSIKKKLDLMLGIEVQDGTEEEKWVEKIADADAVNNFLEKFITIVLEVSGINLSKYGDKSDKWLGLLSSLAVSKIKQAGTYESGSLVPILGTVFIASLLYYISGLVGGDVSDELIGSNYNALLKID